mmetsp:Transcript_1547/g.2434  ORF Transcript_1547/g.2434 Transcript_1547/m.2434 type:complete len:109 (+) Transcript_1547:3413-3739(+)
MGISIKCSRSSCHRLARRKNTTVAKLENIMPILLQLKLKIAEMAQMLLCKWEFLFCEYEESADKELRTDTSYKSVWIFTLWQGFLQNFHRFLPSNSKFTFGQKLFGFL